MSKSCKIQCCMYSFNIPTHLLINIQLFLFVFMLKNSRVSIPVTFPIDFYKLQTSFFNLYILVTYILCAKFFIY